jgi:hypothetical protein
MSKSLVIAMAAASLLALSGSVDAAMTGTTSSIVTTGSTPDCSGAAASAGVIWPPNHTMVSETIVGVTDPYGLPLVIVVTGIMQDESVAALGSGNTSPDGTGVGTSTAQIRAERAGPGTGRIYFIFFSATNSQGAECTGSVSAFVPHDQGQGFTPIDTGVRVDSTQTYF